MRNGSTDQAHVVQLDAQFVVGSRWRLGTSANAKRYAYTAQGQRTSGSDYSQYQVGLSASYALDARSMVYGGLDLGRKRYPVAQASSREHALRAGVYRSFEGSAGLFVNAMGIWRRSRNDALDGFLGERRSDRQQV